MLKFVSNFKVNQELKQRVNTLENKSKSLNEEIVNKILNKFGESETVKKLREDNKRLRQKNKELKALLDEKRNKR